MQTTSNSHEITVKNKIKIKNKTRGRNTLIKPKFLTVKPILFAK
jgi:hypothetical protein